MLTRQELVNDVIKNPPLQVPSHRSLMLENGILDVIFREIKHRFHSLRIKREIGLLLGNLALEESAHDGMVEQGIRSVWLLKAVQVTLKIKYQIAIGSYAFVLSQYKPSSFKACGGYFPTL